LGDHRRLGQIHAAMTHLLGSEGDFGAAVQAGLRALTIATSLGDVPLQVWTGVGLGRVYYAQGDYRRGIQGTRQILDTLQRTPVDERFVQMSVLPSVACRTWLALSLARIGDLAEALAWAGEAARIAEGVDAVRERIWAGYTLGFVHLVRGDVDRATPLFEQAASLCRQGPFPIYLPLVIASLGAAYTMSGRADEALPLLEQAEAEARAIKQVFGYPLILIQTGAAHLEAGKLAEASRYGAAALELARRHGGRGDEAWTLHLLGQIADRKDPPEHREALEQLTEALTLADELGMAPLAARCRLSLSALHHQAGHADDARREPSRAADMLGRMQMRYWLPAAEMLLAVA
jgi:tetratricopeptide (TPR) repeat protein